MKNPLGYIDLPERLPKTPENKGASINEAASLPVKIYVKIWLCLAKPKEIVLKAHKLGATKAKRGTKTMMKKVMVEKMMVKMMMEKMLTTKTTEGHHTTHSTKRRCWRIVIWHWHGTTARTKIGARLGFVIWVIGH